jgi:hypothetical protein
MSATDEEKMLVRNQISSHNLDVDIVDFVKLEMYDAVAFRAV